MRRARIWPLYCAVAAADVALAGRGNRRLRRLTKPLLMPLLIAQAGGRDRLLVSGLALSGLGDVALLSSSESGFTAGLAAFLSAHCFYLAAFGRQRRKSLPAIAPLLAANTAAWVGLNLVLWPHTGRFRVPVLVYGTALTAMAVAAAQTGEIPVALGGVSFMVSDSLLALDTFRGPQRATADAVVMATYTLAQGLIAYGLGDLALDEGSVPA